jgi:hypothetical protein
MIVRVLLWWDYLMKDTKYIMVDFVLEKYSCIINLKLQKQQKRKKISEFLLQEQWGQRVFSASF